MANSKCITRYFLLPVNHSAFPLPLLSADCESFCRVSAHGRALRTVEHGCESGRGVIARDVMYAENAGAIFCSKWLNFREAAGHSIGMSFFSSLFVDKQKKATRTRTRHWLRSKESIACETVIRSVANLLKIAAIKLAMTLSTCGSSQQSLHQLNNYPPILLPLLLNLLNPDRPNLI